MQLKTVECEVERLLAVIGGKRLTYRRAD